MKIKVTKDNVTIDKGELYHSGEYNIHDCTFEFSEEYTDVLVKKALFGVDNKFYEMSILNNQCEIPYDVLKSNGMVILGVYAYEVLEDKLKLRYSPMYDKFFVNLGSYQENIENQEEITSTQFEQYMQALQNGLAEVQSSIDKLNKTTDNANNLVDDINKKLESGEFDGVGITTITSGQATQQDDSTVTPVTVNKTDGSQQTFNVSAKNGINGTDGTDGTNGQDGITPNLQIGTVTTLEPNEQATVTRTGTDEEPLFNFGIPRGQTYQVNNEDLQNIANQITSNANSEFNKNVDSKTTAFNNNAEQKTLDYNNNCISKINSFNQNSTQKLTEFNDNYTSKLNSFNSNANLRMDEYNANADNKIAEYDEHSQELNNKIIDTRNELERVKNDVLETGTDTDTYIHLEDSAMAEYQELSVDGVCEQETTSGKNSLNCNDFVANTVNGITFTPIFNENGTLAYINANGTSTGIIWKSLGNLTYDADTYTFYANSSDNNLRLYQDYPVSFVTTSKTVTFNESITKQIYLNVESGKTLNNAKIYPMVAKASSISNYEPFTNLQPSPNPDYPQPISTIENSLKITSCNKNLFKMNDNYAKGYTSTKNGITLKVEDDLSITLKGTATAKTEFFLSGSWGIKNNRYIPKGIFTISQNGFVDGITSNLGFFKNGVNVQNYGLTYTKTSSMFNSSLIDFDGMSYSISIADGKTIDTRIYTQIESDKKATPYEQHLETQITANLPENEFIGKINDTYKDTLKVIYNEEDGQYHLVLNKMIGKVVLDGSEDWIGGLSAVNSPDYTYFYVDGTYPFIKSHVYECYCNKFTNLGKDMTINTVVNTDTISVGNAPYNKIRIMIKTSRLSSQDIKSFKDLLKNEQPKLYYQLATPYKIDLGVVDMPLSYDEITNIFTDSDLLPTINAKYYRNFTKTVQNLQVNEKALKQELIDINNRLSALETATTNVTSESEVTE